MGDEALRRWYVRPLGALLLLASEYLFLSLAFDAFSLTKLGGPLGGLGWVGLVGPALFAFATALWVLGGNKLRETLSCPTERRPSRTGRHLALHFLCFAGLVVVSATLFGANAPPAGPPWAWIALWTLAGVATAASWLPVALGGVRPLTLVRELSIPLAIAILVAFFAVAAGLATVELWDGLSDVTMHSVAWLLDLVVSPTHFDPQTAAIGTERFGVIVTPVCSGYEGIGLILVFLSAYLVGFRKQLRFPNVLVLIPAAVILVWLLNVLRIVSLIIVGHYVSEGIAIGGFHSKAGWLVFCGVALGAVWLTQRATWFAVQPSQRSHATTNPSAPFLLPLLAVIATALLTGLFVDEFDYFYPLRVLVALLVLAWYRDDYLEGLRQHLRGRRLFSWEATAIGVAVYVVWVGVAAWRDPQLAAEPPTALAGLSLPLSISWIAARILGSAVTVPVVEELAFRGFLLRRVMSSDFNKAPYDKWHWPAALVSSLAFAAAHQEWIGGFVAGMLYAYAQKRRGLLSDAILAHAVTNALIAFQVLNYGHWSLW